MTNRLLDKWEPEYPGALVFPANEDNVLGTTVHPPTHIVIHTPEEEADEYFATPRWFAQYHPNQRGSTNAAIDVHGFCWECVPPNVAPIANGVIGKPHPPGADPNRNLNYASRSVEVEGRAATMHLTCPPTSSQFRAVVNWCVFLCRKYGLDETRIIAHRDVANNRSDPGTFDMNELRKQVAAQLNEEDDMTEEEVVAILSKYLKSPVDDLRFGTPGEGARTWAGTVKELITDVAALKASGGEAPHRHNIKGMTGLNEVDNG